MDNPLPNRLKEFRKKAGYTQKEAAKKMGLESSSRLSDWEQGIAAPNAVNLLKLSELYRTQPKNLYPELFKQIRDEAKQERKKHKKEAVVPNPSKTNIEMIEISPENEKTDDELLDELAEIMVDIFLEEEGCDNESK